MSFLEIVRLAVGLPAVLLLPGWLWSLAAFPRSRALGSTRTGPGELDVVERAVVAFGLSVAAISLAALAWSAGLGLPLGDVGSVALLAVVCGAGAGAWRWRLAREAKAAPDDPS
ncbi:MAG: DUF1616 domain-containing protein [Thermoplasmatota archaeon]